jgi:hypothetical protein
VHRNARTDDESAEEAGRNELKVVKAMQFDDGRIGLSFPSRYVNCNATLEHSSSKLSKEHKYTRRS